MFGMLDRNVDYYRTLGYLRAYDRCIDSYSSYLEGFPRKIMWSIFFNPSCDFSKTFDKVKRILIVFGVIFFFASYLVFSKLWSQEFDKLLRVLTTSDLADLLLKL